MVNKYDFELNINSNSSHSNILRSIKENSVVLEFGAANGIMTKYMHDTLNCQVHIVEMNLEDGLRAAEFAESCYIGEEDGNVEKYKWFNQDIKFDYIVAADLLEHLYEPWNVLKKAVYMLKDGGSILISVPNIANNALVLDLFNGKFEYRPLGLLDNTHIRFFTRSSLKKIVEEAGLMIYSEMNTYCDVGFTEFKNSWFDLDEVVANAFKSRKEGNLYQFVWELRKV